MARGGRDGGDAATVDQRTPFGCAYADNAAWSRGMAGRQTTGHQQATPTPTTALRRRKTRPRPRRSRSCTEFQRRGARCGGAQRTHPGGDRREGAAHTLRAPWHVLRRLLLSCACTRAGVAQCAANSEAKRPTRREGRNPEQGKGAATRGHLSGFAVKHEKPESKIDLLIGAKI